MATTAKIGILLLVLLLIWIVVYYQMVAPAMVEPKTPSGLTLTTGDTVGIAPDETSGGVSGGAGGEGESQEAEKSAVDGAGQVSDNNNTLDNINEPNRESHDDAVDHVQDQEEAGGSDLPVEPVVIPAPPPTTPYTVKHGDTMQTIAKEWFGSYDKWVIISQENPLADPQKLKVGQVLRLPAKDTRLESIPSDLYQELTKEIEYTVSSGDTLSGIARQFYGKADLYPVIMKANRDRIRDADSLVVGMKLRIPKYQQPAD